MSLLIRICLVVTIVFALGAIYAGVQLKGAKAKLTEEKGNLEASLQKQTAETGAAQQRAAAEETAKKKALADLDETKKVADQTRSDLTSLKARSTETEQKLQAVQQDLTAKQAEIEKFTKALPPGMTIDQVKSKLTELQTQFATLDQEKNILREQLTKLDGDKKKLEDQLTRRSQGKMPPGLTGHIMAVNPDWNFVVIDIGANDGVVENAAMIVYRDGKLVGKIKITSVEPSIAIADILTEWQQAIPQEGDTATF